MVGSYAEVSLQTGGMSARDQYAQLNPAIEGLVCPEIIKILRLQVRFGHLLILADKLLQQGITMNLIAQHEISSSTFLLRAML